MCTVNTRDTYLHDPQSPKNQSEHIVPKLLHVIGCTLQRTHHSSCRQRNQFKSLSAEAGLPANQIHGMLRIE